MLLNPISFPHARAVALIGISAKTKGMTDNRWKLQTNQQPLYILPLLANCTNILVQTSTITQKECKQLHLRLFSSRIFR